MENVILKNQTDIDDISAIAADYKLSKIVLVRG
jgi:hypothetical protein